VKKTTMEIFIDYFFSIASSLINNLSAILARLRYVKSFMFAWVVKTLGSQISHPCQEYRLMQLQQCCQIPKVKCVQHTQVCVQQQVQEQQQVQQQQQQEEQQVQQEAQQVQQVEQQQEQQYY